MDDSKSVAEKFVVEWNAFWNYENTNQMKERKSLLVDRLMYIDCNDSDCMRLRSFSLTEYIYIYIYIYIYTHTLYIHTHIIYSTTYY